MAGTLTEGRIGVTPLTLYTDSDLGDLRAALSDRRYTGDVTKPGWGSLEDDEERLGRRLRNRPRGGEPQHVRSPRRGPERVEARLYFDRLDTRLQSQADQQIDKSYLYVSDAIDVVFTEAEGGLDALASSSNSGDVRRYVVSALRGLSDTGDEITVDIGRRQGPVDPDLPLWLIHRFNSNGQLTPQILLTDLRGVNTMDARDRPSRMLRELLITRPVLQAAITEAGVQFGSIKLTAHDDECQVEVDFELRGDGGFAASRSYSEYDSGHGPTYIDFGRVIADDLAFSIIPRIEHAHANDAAWHRGGRARFLADARGLLRSVAP